MGKGWFTGAGRYSEAIPLAERVLAITEQAMGPDHPGQLYNGSNQSSSSPEVPKVTIIPSLSRLLPLALLTLGLGACGGVQLGSLSSSTSHQGMDHAHSMDLGPVDATYDLRFLDAMVVHHQGAVTMAETALKHSQRPEIRQLAEGMLASQTREIDQMQAWRKAWYGS